ncbi:sigma-54-dependent transcriptional regulator [Desulfonema magnum]|uniref:DNA-binding transcriptional regulator NtrC n=1 Tax=Desulfonema magnum TaxID=45655 RepID=A0A975BTS2_9BACT|nr:sigma-54 dependent transcriptional regulator [Desulfonema magnum]QTA91119.1 Two component system response regulator, sigma54-specific [Desulfonema magnum]
MAKILLIDDEYSILESLDMFLSEKGHHVFKAATGKEGLGLFRQHRPDVVILDIRLPDLNGLDILSEMQESEAAAKVIMITAFQDMETTIQAMKRGAYDYILKPLDADEVEKAVEQSLEVLKAEQDIPCAEDAEKTASSDVIIGKSEKMLEIFKMIGLLCQNRAPVLIQGETGTGKELIARVIHQNSPYNEEPFVTLDCSAVVETLLESELFGHEKGAFTGATHKNKGKIEVAGKGTLFLDEMGELPLSLQGKFLGFLQRREFMRVGGHQVLNSRCRIIAATNRDLAVMVRHGRFKEDLYYRLKVVTIYAPPLRERLSDIPLLADYFLQKINNELGAEVSKFQHGVMDRLMTHPWTGNVRELENALVEAVVRSRGKVILLEAIEKILGTYALQSEGPSSYSLSGVEKHHIQNTLSCVNWNRTKASRMLGISLPTLRSKIRKYGIVPHKETEL